jgi:hypothetical protein
MDLRWGFNNIWIREGDERKAAFIMPMGLFELMVMQFGLCNAPSTFQRMVNEVLAEEKSGGHVVVYIDDILVHTKMVKENQKWTRRVLQKLRDNKLYCRREKCMFEVDEVEFLGVTLGHGTVKISKKKTEAIEREEPPTTILYQIQEDGEYHPVGYTLKSYNDTEKNYTTYDKEMLGVMRGLEEWRNLLIEVAKPLKIMTDHRNLTYFREPQKLTSRQVN